MNNLNQLHTTKGKFYALHMLFNALYILYRLKIDDNRIAIDRYIAVIEQLETSMHIFLEGIIFSAFSDLYPP